MIELSKLEIVFLEEVNMTLESMNQARKDIIILSKKDKLEIAHMLIDNDSLWDTIISYISENITFKNQYNIDRKFDMSVVGIAERETYERYLEIILPMPPATVVNRHLSKMIAFIDSYQDSLRYEGEHSMRDSDKYIGRTLNEYQVTAKEGINHC